MLVLLAACCPRPAARARVRRVGTHNTSVVLEVQEDTVSSLPGLGLTDDDGGVDLLAELGLSLLDGGHAVRSALSAVCFFHQGDFMLIWQYENGASVVALVVCALGVHPVCRRKSRSGGEIKEHVHHVTDTTSRQSVQAGTDTLDGDDVQVSCARVVCAVHDGTAIDPCQLFILAPGSRWTLVVVFHDREIDMSRGRVKNLHGETEGHLELATGGTTTVHKARSAKPNPAMLCCLLAVLPVPSLSIAQFEALRSLRGGCWNWR